MTTKTDRASHLSRWSVFVLCEAFALGTVLWLATTRQYDRLAMAAITLLLVTLPAVMERLLRQRMRTPIFLFGMLYAVGPMLGQCYGLYYRVTGWDKLLHICGGVAFALFALYLFEVVTAHHKPHRVLCAAFALCVSVTLSVVWECVEFGCDQLLGTDMQTDTVVSEIHSYQLSNESGKAGTAEGITETTINGRPIPVKGYLDIGLADTMWDMILETIASLAVVLLYLFDRARHPLFLPIKT